MIAFYCSASVISKIVFELEFTEYLNDGGSCFIELLNWINNDDKPS